MPVTHLLKALLTQQGEPTINWFAEEPNTTGKKIIEQADRVEADQHLVRGLRQHSILSKILAEHPKIAIQLDLYQELFPALKALDQDGYSAAVNNGDKKTMQTILAANRVMRLNSRMLNGMPGALGCGNSEDTEAFKAISSEKQAITDYSINPNKDEFDYSIIDTGREQGLKERLVLARTNDDDAPIYEAVHQKLHKFICEPEISSESLNIIILTYNKSDDDKMPYRIDVHAAAKWQPLLAQAMHKRLRKSRELFGTRAWMMGKDELHLRLESLDRKASSAVSNFVDFLLNEMVIGARPLQAWRASFFATHAMEL